MQAYIFLNLKILQPKKKKIQLMVVGSYSPEPHSPVHRIISRAFQVENVGWQIFKCGLKNNKEHHLFSSTAKGCFQFHCPGHCDKCQYTQLKSRTKRRRQSLYTSQVQTNPQGLIVPHVFAEVLKTLVMFCENFVSIFNFEHIHKLSRLLTNPEVLTIRDWWRST